MLIISNRWKSEGICMRLLRYMWDTFLELDTTLNAESIQGNINKPLSLHTIRVSNKNALSALWIKCLPIFRGNPSPCTWTKNTKVGHFWFEAAPSLLGVLSLTDLWGDMFWSPHRSVRDNTHYKAWSSLKPEVTHFRIFRSCAWAQIPSEKMSAFWLDTPTMWRDIGLLIFPRTGSSLSEVSNSRKVSHMYLNIRMQTPSFFHLSEMKSMHMSTLLQTRFFIQRTQMIQI